MTQSRKQARRFVYNALNDVKNPIDSFSQNSEILANVELVLNDIASWFKQRLPESELNELLEFVDRITLRHEKSKWFVKTKKSLAV